MRRIVLGLFAFLITSCDCGSSSNANDGSTQKDGPNADTALANELCPEGCQCSDGVDNDGDGTIDGADVECTGPYDNDEGSFATGIPGDNRDPVWQDCFYDGNSGAGDDGCRYRSECLTGELPTDDPNCSVTEECLEFCRPRTPNGCDCFGCCEVMIDEETTINIQIGAGCSLENATDESICPRCEQDNECTNECGTCELCPGREEADLPNECFDQDAGTPGYQCDDGTRCETNADCSEGFYCSLGCCLVILI